MNNVRILVIDDEKVIREGVERALAKRDYEIFKAEDGNRGLETAQGRSISISS